MGEAKKRREAMRSALLSGIEHWMHPASTWEVEDARDVASLSVLTIYRWPEDRLRKMGLTPNECHSNAKFVADHDYEKKTRHVLGWLVDNIENFVLHSICENDGDYFCVTPMTVKEQGPILFIPDPAITMTIVNDQFVFQRKGHPLSGILRSNPEGTRASYEVFKRKLLDGADPFKAMYGKI